MVSSEYMQELYRLSNIRRYNTQTKIKDENVATHSYFVALFTKIICDELQVGNDIKLTALDIALLHDIAEIQTNDITNDAKVSMPDINKILKECEKKFIKNNFPQDVEKLFIEETNILNFKKVSLAQKIVSLADTLSVIQYSKNEISLGNKTFFGILKVSVKALEQKWQDINSFLFLEDLLEKEIN